MKTSLITPAYHRDAKLLDLACAQVDIFCPAHEHIIIVSQQKRREFAHLESHNRKIVAIEDVIGAWRAPVHYRKRELYFYKGRRPVDGWVMQQLIKLAAPDFTDAELLLNLDSDVFFVRPFKLADFVEEGRVRLLRKVPALAAFQRVWHTRARALFGLPAAEGLEPDYVGSLIAWRRDVCLELRDRLARQGGAPWLEVLTREKNFSEYTLYGAFVDQVLGGAPERHYISDRELCLNSWDWRQDGDLAQTCVTALKPHQVAINLQSNLRLPFEQSREIVKAVTRRTAGEL